MNVEAEMRTARLTFQCSEHTKRDWVRYCATVDNLRKPKGNK